MEFNLNKQTAKIAHLNIREEKHGDEDMLAIDVKVKADVSNAFLSYLSPTLKWSLYDHKDSREPELLEDKDHMPVLRYPSLPTLKWDGTMFKAQVVIHGLRKADDLELEADVKKLVLEPKEGGTVSITFSVTTLPTPGQAGALAALLSQEVKVSVAPADAGGEE